MKLSHVGFKNYFCDLCGRRDFKNDEEFFKHNDACRKLNWKKFALAAIKSIEDDVSYLKKLIKDQK